MRSAAQFEPTRFGYTRANRRELSVGGFSEYQDVLVKVNGRWLFAQRHVEDILGKRGQQASR
jgi:hypothetical protein